MGRFIDSVKKAASSVKKTIQKTIPEVLKKNKTIVSAKKETVVPEQEGLTYIVVNDSLPFQMKCGEHHKSFDIENRVKGLNCTSVSENFKPICVVKSKHCGEIERKIHAKFLKYRINARREFFGFKIGTMTSSTEFECIKKSYEKLLKRMVKKMHKYALKYGGEIVI
jgi:hypothetical protein